MDRRTRIVCTVGPAVSDSEKLEALVLGGMNIARLNFSHGDHADFARVISELRQIEKKVRRPVGILADIQGPKIRIGKLRGGQVELVHDGEVWISNKVDEGGVLNDGRLVLSTTYKDFCKDVGVGNQILLDDGLLELKVIEKVQGEVRCLVVNGGVLTNHKGINVPDVSFSVHTITEKDYSDILFCVEQGVDFIALSFVRSAQEIRHLKSFLSSRQKSIQVIAKIEMREAINNLEEIIDVSDGVLVARGDLAVEVGSERVPVLQKRWSAGLI